MTPQQIEALKLALEALQFALHVGFDESSESQIKKGDKAGQQHRKAITDIKQALAEHAMREVQRLGQEIEQEPVAYYLPHKGFYWAKPTSISTPTIADVEPLPFYTHPPQRKPLTDKAITQVIDSMPKKMKGFGVDWDLYEFARAIEAKPQENT